MKILLSNLTKMVNDSGGLAKVTSAFANEMKKRGHQVSLVYSDVTLGEFFYPLDKDIKAYDIRHYNGQTISYPWYLKIKREFFRLFDKQKARTVNNDFAFKFLRDNLNDILNRVNPDIIVSFQPASSKMLLCDLNTRTPVITMSHGDPEDYFHFYPSAEIPALEKSTVCQVLLPIYEKHLLNHLPSVKTIVIGNAIPQYTIQAQPGSKKKTHTILFIGRLSKNHKRPHILIQAFADIAEEFPNWNVEILGAIDGKAYYEELKFLINKSNLENRIFLKGTTQNVSSVLKKGDIFAFPSAYEGFSLALGEAMSMGLPSIAFKSCISANGMIDNEKTGILCEDGVDEFKKGLIYLMNDSILRHNLGYCARLSMKKFSPEAIWCQWERLLEDSIMKN